MQVQPVAPEGFSPAAPEEQHDSPGGKTKYVIGKVKDKAKKLKDKFKNKSAGSEPTTPDQEENAIDDEGKYDQSPPDQELKSDNVEENEGLANRDIDSDKFEGASGAHAPGTESVQDNLGQVNLGSENADENNLQERAATASADEKCNEEVTATPEKSMDEKSRDVSGQSTDEQLDESAAPAYDYKSSAPPEEEKYTSVQPSELEQELATKDTIMQNESQPHRAVSATKSADAPTDPSTEDETFVTQDTEGCAEQRGEELPPSNHEDAEGNKGYKDLADEKAATARDTIAGAAASAAETLGYNAHDKSEKKPLEEAQEKPYDEQVSEDFTTDKESDIGAAVPHVGYDGGESNPELHDGKEVSVASESAEEQPAVERDMTTDDSLSTRAVASENAEEEEIPAEERGITSHEQVASENAEEQQLPAEERDITSDEQLRTKAVASENSEEQQLPTEDRIIPDEEQLSTGEDNRPDVDCDSEKINPEVHDGKEVTSKKAEEEQPSTGEETKTGLKDTIFSKFGYGGSSPSTEPTLEKGEEVTEEDEKPQAEEQQQQQLDPNQQQVSSQDESKPTTKSNTTADTFLGFKNALALKFGYGAGNSPTSQTVDEVRKSPDDGEQEPVH